MSPRNLQIDVHADRVAPARPPLSPQEIAQRRTAEFGVSVIKWTIGVPAILLACVSGFYLALFAWGLADSWGEAMRMALLAIAYTLVVAGLPTVAALMQRAYPHEAHRALAVWHYGVAVSFIGIATFVLSAEHAHSTGGWSPRDLLPNTDYGTRLASAGHVDPTQIKRILVLFLSLGAVAGSGILGRWAVLGTAESHRLAYADLGPQQTPAAAPETMLAPAVGSGDILERWWNYSVRHRPGAETSMEKLYDNYVAKCEGICNPLHLHKFGKVLTQLASVPNSGIGKRQSYGKWVYTGIELVDDSQGIIDMVPVQQLERPR